MPAQIWLSKESNKTFELLGKAYGFDVFSHEHDINFKLSLKPYLDLVIEKHEPHIFSMFHFYVQQGDVMFDPEIIFLIDDTKEDIPETLIFPIEITMHPVGYRNYYGNLNSNRNKLESYQPKEMRDLSSFANTWLKNIRDQEWLLPGGKPNPEVEIKESTFEHY